MVGQFKKAYLHRPIKILHFLTLARIQKYLLQFNIQIRRFEELQNFQNQIIPCNLPEIINKKIIVNLNMYFRQKM